MKLDIKELIELRIQELEAIGLIPKFIICDPKHYQLLNEKTAQFIMSPFSRDLTSLKLKKLAYKNYILFVIEEWEIEGLYVMGYSKISEKQITDEAKRQRTFQKDVSEGKND